MADHDLYLGTEIDGDERVTLDMDHLTTHAVCVGMTGSGKTGLGIVALEELARRGVSLLVIDLKGDMVDLLLNFPSLSGDEFAPWLPPDALEDGVRSEVASKQADFWRKGLEGSGLGPEDLRAVRDGVRWQLLTPGAGSAAPLDILPALSAPEGWDPDDDPDGATDRVNGITSALLSLVGRGGDPLSDRDHVLTATVILDHWRRGRALDLAGLLSSLIDPPMDSLGALSMESFYPRDDRMKLVMALNTLLASPAFAAWTEGMPMDMDHLLGDASDPRASIISVAHLDERQRHFVIALLTSELVAWMRRQPASSGLRALLYMDEVHGIIPPYPKNPPTKSPLLTLFKQGRAYGVGAWMATQNPVDLDYKALGNAGVKLVGRLITDADRKRALEGLGMAKLPDGSNAEKIVTRLGKRQFLLTDVRAKQRVRKLGSRWAMSYMRGPITLSEMGPLLKGQAAETASQEVPETGQKADSVRQAPPLAAAVSVAYAEDGSGMASPSVVVRNRFSVQRATLDLYREVEEVWRFPIADDGRVEWEEGESLSEAPALADEAPEGMRFPAAAPGRMSSELKKAASAFASWRARRPLMIQVNEKLKMVAGEGETQNEFVERCLEAADRADDATQDRVRKRFEGRMKTLKKRLERERDELERDQTQLSSRKAEEKMGMVEGLFSVLLGSRSVSSASRKAASKMKTAAGKRRMRQTAESAVIESENEIERLEAEIEGLADELQDEVDRIAAESEEKAEQIEEKAFKAKKADIEVRDLWLVWG
ncbi:helicase HerA domain-containing protein [Acidobacteriota bacterium]